LFNAIQKATDKVINLFLYISCAYLLYILFACFMQVFSRYVLNSSFSWTEETARYAFISMGMLAAPVALRKNMHVKIDLLETMLKSERSKAIQKFVVTILVGFVSCLFFMEGINLINSTWGLTTTATQLPVIAFYYTVPLSGFGCLWVCLLDLIAMLSPQKLKEEQNV